MHQLLLTRLKRFFLQNGNRVSPDPSGLSPCAQKTPGTEGKRRSKCCRWWKCRKIFPLPCESPSPTEDMEPRVLVDRLDDIIEDTASSFERKKSLWPLATVRWEENLPLNNGAIERMLKKITARKEDLQDCPLAEMLEFVKAVVASCRAAQKNGQVVLEHPFQKAELAQALVVVLESLQVRCVSVLACSMLALYHLSKFQPPLDRDLESSILHLTLEGVFSTQGPLSHGQDFCAPSLRTLERLLVGLLSSDPTDEHLVFLLNHINIWLESLSSRKEALAICCASNLLQHATHLISLKTSECLPNLGQLVTIYALRIASYRPEMSHHARVALSCLYTFLLHRNGLPNEHLVGDLWCEEECDELLADYIDTCRVGEAFSKILREEERKEMISSAWLAIYDFHTDSNMAGVLLLYGIAGKSYLFSLDRKPEIVEQRIAEHLLRLQKGKEVPTTLESLVDIQDDLVLEDIEDIEH